MSMAGNRVNKRASHNQAQKLSSRLGTIHIKKSHEGLLHKDLGVKAGEKIPAKKLDEALDSSNPKLRKRAQFAENAKHFKH